MAVLIDGDTRVITQGITGEAGTFHTLQGVDADAQDTNPTGAHLATGNEDSYDDQFAPNVSMSSLAKGNSGGTQAHDNMQPYLTMNFIIALVGIFPSRN